MGRGVAVAIGVADGLGVGEAVVVTLVDVLGATTAAQLVLLGLAANRHAPLKQRILLAQSLFAVQLSLQLSAIAL